MIYHSDDQPQFSPFFYYTVGKSGKKITDDQQDAPKKNDGNTQRRNQFFRGKGKHAKAKDKQNGADADMNGQFFITLSLHQ